jgi:Transposase DDE domain group 1
MCMNSSRSKRFQPVEIGNIGGIRTVIEAVPEQMTVLGGAPMMAAIEKKTGLVRELSRRVNDERAQHMIDHKAFDILKQRVLQIGAGFTDGNDCDWLRGDAGILMGLDRNPVDGQPGASQETVSRFESKAINKKNAKRMREIFIDHYISKQKQRPKKIELDCDGSMFKTYGAQEGSIFRGGKYGHQMYFPLKIASGENLLATMLRRGDQSESATILAELKMVVGKLRAKWPGLKIKVRLDSAFGSPELYKWLRKNQLGYEIGFCPNKVVDFCAKAFMDEAEAQFKAKYGEPRFLGKDGNKRFTEYHALIRGLPNKAERMKLEHEMEHRRGRVVGSFCYKAETWQHGERIICRIDYTDKGLDVRYVVVSQQNGEPQKIYEQEYCKRGLAEQNIESFKQAGLKLSAQAFHANQLRLIMYGIAYTLLKQVRDYTGKTLKRAEINTVRKVLMLMPMVVRQMKKKIVLQISETHSHCREFLQTMRRLSTAKLL